VQMHALLVQVYTAGLRDLAIVRMDDDAVARELVDACLAYLRVRDEPVAPTEGKPPGESP